MVKTFLAVAPLSGKFVLLQKWFDTKQWTIHTLNYRVHVSSDTWGRHVSSVRLSTRWYLGGCGFGPCCRCRLCIWCLCLVLLGSHSDTDCMCGQDHSNDDQPWWQVLRCCYRWETTHLAGVCACV